jgi:hypothetical protein
MKSWMARALAIGATCALFAIACGGEDAIGAGGVSGDKRLLELSPADSAAVCDDVQAKCLAYTSFVEDFCTAVGASDQLASQGSGDSGTAVCDSVAKDCSSRPASFIHICPDAVTVCDATVAEFAQCWEDACAGTRSMTCAAQIAFQQNAAKMQAPSAKPSRCSEVINKCFAPIGAQP